ncbi:hypothetical protein EAH80_16910 [Mycobacterium hodleri]|uniref:Mce protein n=2 Tax=Mycolicibacterium hodleri TaxID=49897 RepID=A0A502E7A7_9MYCO|nr:hypothetical protein [Mycolicibacterium hodleri]TPG33234.1 hypothetical protein EAH80_16910 [Mycolicibacterium hodleri]
MPPRKRASSVLNGDAHDEPKDGPADVDAIAGPDDALALAEQAEAEAEAAEADAAAARARARALRLRRQAEAAATAKAPPAPVAATSLQESTLGEEASAPEAAETDADVEAHVAEPIDDTQLADEDGGEPDADADGTEEELAQEPRRRRRPRIRLAWVAAALVVICTLGLLAASAYMVVHHRQVTQEQQRSAEFAAAARQGVVTLMSLNFSTAADDVKRIIDNTTGDFKKDFQGQADEFTKVAQESKVVTEATVNATAVQKMNNDAATVLVAVTTQVSNVASKEQQPRSWRLRVDIARDGGQLKLAKVEFVP